MVFNMVDLGLLQPAATGSTAENFTKRRGRVNSMTMKTGKRAGAMLLVGTITEGATSATALLDTSGVAPGSFKATLRITDAADRKNALLFEFTEPLDKAILASAQAVEHYEITRYGTLIAWAEQLGRDDCARHRRAGGIRHVRDVALEHFVITVPQGHPPDRVVLVPRRFLDRRAQGVVGGEQRRKLWAERDPAIGYATVYRTLKLLTESGVANERRFGSGNLLAPAVPSPLLRNSWLMRRGSAGSARTPRGSSFSPRARIPANSPPFLREAPLRRAR